MDSPIDQRPKFCEAARVESVGTCGVGQEIVFTACLCSNLFIENVRDQDSEGPTFMSKS